MQKVLAPLEILPFGADAMRAYGPLRAGLQRRGEPIGALDMLIAAHALALGATPATRNPAGFRRVPALVCENRV